MKKQRATDHYLYTTWEKMHKRCKNNYPNYKYINVCRNWHGVEGFWQFVEDMGHRPEGHTLDRINHNDDYSALNCRWADIETQSLNKANTVLLSCGTPLVQWCKENNKSYETLRQRIKNLGWEEKRALDTPCSPFKEKEKEHYLYSTWKGIRNRCNKPEHPQYKDYGYRGIEICIRWVDNFEQFKNDIIEHLGHRPEGHTLDRIDVNGDYELSNLKWANSKEQNRNRTNTLYLPDGRKFVDVCEQNGIPYNTAKSRLHICGWDIEDACTLPKGSRNPKKKKA